MALIGATILGAAGQVASGRLLRLSLGATWRPSTTALGAVSGILAGPPGSVGELTLVNPTTLGVNPFVAVVQGTHATNQGQYEVPNDAYATLTITAQHASQFRRTLVAVTVDDSQAAGVASSPTTDRARLHLIDGALSATAPAPLPAVPANTLLLGEVAIPPVGQTVTLTPYNPRTTTRGGILPVFDDASTTPGHGSAAGAYVGEYRDHPLYGAQRWNGTAWEGGNKPGPWIAPTLTGRTNLATDYREVKYRYQPATDSVRIHGILASGAGQTPLFTLPVGLRPPRHMVYPAQSGDTASLSIFVMSTGFVNIPATASWLAIDCDVPLTM